MNDFEFPESYQKEINLYREIHLRFPPNDILKCSKFYTMENDKRSNPIQNYILKKNQYELLIHSLKRLIRFIISSLSLFFILFFNKLFVKDIKLSIKNNIEIKNDLKNKIFNNNQETSKIIIKKDKTLINDIDIKSFLKLKDILKYLYINFYYFFFIPNLNNSIKSFIYNLNLRINELNFSTIEIVILARIINEERVRRIYFIYEDLPSDRLLLRLIKTSNISTFGIIHSPLMHIYRYNLYENSYNNNIYPKYIISKYHQKSENILKIKQYKSKLIKQKIIKTKTVLLTKLKFILICHPNDANLSKELITLGDYLKSSNKLFTIIHLFHPNLNKKNIKYLSYEKKSCYVISSFMTNKGYEMHLEGYNTLYFGSEIQEYYNPVKNLNIMFVENKKTLSKFFYKLNV